MNLISLVLGSLRSRHRENRLWKIHVFRVLDSLYVDSALCNLLLIIARRARKFIKLATHALNLLGAIDELLSVIEIDFTSCVVLRQNRVGGLSRPVVFVSQSVVANLYGSLSIPLLL